MTFALTIVILGAFAAWEFRAKDPMLDLRFFRNPRFTAGATSITLVFFVMFGTFFIITQYLQLVLGYSPLEAGIRVLPWAAVYMVSTTRSAGLVDAVRPAARREHRPRHRRARAARAVTQHRRRQLRDRRARA